MKRFIISIRQRQLAELTMLRRSDIDSLSLVASGAHSTMHKLKSIMSGETAAREFCLLK